MQVSWNRTGGNGETNLISYQGPGSNGGFTLANVNTAGTYQELLSLKSGAINLTNTAINLISTGGYTTINGLNNTSIKVVGGNGNVAINFHSNATPTYFDARIWCDTANGTTMGGILTYTARQHVFESSVNFFSGISFTKGNLTAPFYIQNGTRTMTGILGAGNAMTPVYQAFPTQWGGTDVPIIQLTLWTTNTGYHSFILRSINEWFLYLYV